MRQHRNDTGNHNRRGFSMVELAIVITIIGLLFTAGTVMLKSYILSIHVKTTQNHMADIDQAIVQFIRVNGKLPCVADLSAPQGTAGFGVEVNTNCSLLTASANNSYYVHKTNNNNPNNNPALPTLDVAIGAVPTRSLDIPDEDMVDGWGNRFTYVVTMELASPPATGTVVDFTRGAITINDLNGNPYITPSDSATYLVISHGQDGVGAFQGYPTGPSPPGTAPAIACPNPGNIPEHFNCFYQIHGTGSTTPESFVTSLTRGEKLSGSGYVLYDDYVSVGTANSGVLTSDTKIVTGLSGPRPPLTNPTIGVNPYTVTSTSPYYADCTAGYTAVACSGLSTTAGAFPCQGIPDTNDPVTFLSSCKYNITSGACTNAAAYNFFTTCVRF